MYCESLENEANSVVKNLSNLRMALQNFEGDGELVQFIENRIKDTEANLSNLLIGHIKEIKMLSDLGNFQVQLLKWIETKKCRHEVLSDWFDTVSSDLEAEIREAQKRIFEDASDKEAELTAVIGSCLPGSGVARFAKESLNTLYLEELKSLKGNPGAVLNLVDRSYWAGLQDHPVFLESKKIVNNLRVEKVQDSDDLKFILTQLHKVSGGQYDDPQAKTIIQQRLDAVGLEKAQQAENFNEIERIVNIVRGHKYCDK